MRNELNASRKVAELLFGLSAPPAGRRQQLLTEAVEGLLALFGGRVLPFEMEAAVHYAELATLGRTKARGFPTPDGYIAAIAASRGFIAASRDTAAFQQPASVSSTLSLHSQRHALAAREWLPRILPRTAPPRMRPCPQAVASGSSPHGSRVSRSC